MELVQLEMERNCMAASVALKWRWIEADFYCNYNKEYHLLWRG